MSNRLNVKIKAAVERGQVLSVLQIQRVKYRTVYGTFNSGGLHVLSVLLESLDE
jgi:hypothetical protein